MRNAFGKNIFREIRGSRGRYFAIIAIIALGVGFFSGLKICKNAMLDTGDAYLREHAFYDFRLVSSLGLTPEDVDAFRTLPGIREAEGAYFSDALVTGEDGNDRVYKFHSLTETMNQLKLDAGTLPVQANECAVDAKFFSADDIGKTIVISSENTEDTSALFSQTTYIITALVHSPSYLNYERGTTSLGTGTVSGFIYIPAAGFDSACYTEVYLRADTDAFLYSDAYTADIDALEPSVSELLEMRADNRWQSVVDEAQGELDAARAEYEQSRANALGELDAQAAQLQASIDGVNAQLARISGLGMQYEEEELRYTLTQLESAMTELDAARANAMETFEETETDLADAQAEIDAIAAPTCFTLTRESNTGYVCFQNDTAIVDGIANVFPIFFFLVAALVCTTTMTRMVDEQRTQAGVMRALGYSGSSIIIKYSIYAGSAAVIGCVIGYSAGTFVFPRVIWEAYGIMYGFADIDYKFSPLLAVVSLLVSLACSVLAVFLAAKKELTNTPASLIRPKSPKSGKRIWLEYIPFLWRRLSFLVKVSIRNVFRYKKRFAMMLLGIGGCTALLLTGFGIRDSVQNVVNYQYDEITRFDLSVAFTEGRTESERNSFQTDCAEAVSEVLFLHTGSVDAVSDTGFKSTNLVVFNEGTTDISPFVSLHSGDTPIALPGPDEVILNEKLANTLDLRVGDALTLRDSDMREMTLTVSGIFTNYIYNYVYVNAASYTAQLGEPPAYDAAYVNVPVGMDVHQAASVLLGAEHVANVSVNADMRSTVDKMMSCLDYIVILITFCAGALAFIVLYNLTNINIAERVREIATIKVLGFYLPETSAYVFRENLIMTVIGALIGLPLGKLLHAFVISQINIDMISFDIRVSGLSYALSIGLTILFALIVNLAMSVKIGRLDMAQSLKSIE